MSETIINFNLYNIHSNLKQNDKFYGNHRSGLKYALKGLLAMDYDAQFPIFDPCPEKTFVWGDKCKQYFKPWVCIIHGPYYIPEWYDSRMSSNSFFRNKNFVNSLEFCKGIYVFSETYKKQIRHFIPEHIDINVLYHPTEFVIPKFCYNCFTNTKRVIHIGYWLRDPTLFYKLKCNYKKILIKPPDKNGNVLLNRCIKLGNLTNDELSSVNLMDTLCNDMYDDIFSNSIVFLNLIDSVVNNVIIECIVRNTPVLVNKLDSVVEYLGLDYPFYYNSLEEACLLVNSYEKIKETYKYLHDMNKDFLKLENFTDSLLKSEIYKTLQPESLNSYDIHQIWLGENKQPSDLMNTFKNDYITMYPKYSYHLWNESNIDVLFTEFPNIKIIYDMMNSQHGKYILLRYLILYHFGGVIIDKYKIWVNNSNFDKLLINSDNLFIGKDHKGKNNFGVIGSKFGNDIILEIVERIEGMITKNTKRNRDHILRKINNIGVNKLFGINFFNSITKDKITIFPAYYFHCKDINEESFVCDT